MFNTAQNEASILLTLVFLSAASQANGEDIDISGFVDYGFTIRCSQTTVDSYLEQIEIIFTGDSGGVIEPTLTVDIFRTIRDRPDRREDNGRSFYGWGKDEAKISIGTFASSTGSFEILVEVDNSNDGEIYQFSGSNKESYVTLGQWKFTNFNNLLRIEEPILVQESVSFYKGRISNTVNKTWRQCTMLADDGSYLDLEWRLENYE